MGLGLLRIWKYQLPNSEHPVIKIPKGSKVLCFKFQNKVPCIWVFVNVEAKEEEHKFWLVETGQIMNIDPSFLYYINSDQYETPQGPYVAHLFEFVKKGSGNIF
jgi:hypothetical protein